MREIKFRGKWIDNGEWVCGFLHKLYDGTCLIISYGAGGFTIVSGEVVFQTAHVYEVDSETVGQYTGLKDKNGTEIYEGDILKDTLGWVFEVRWDNENGRFLGYHSKPRGDTYICYVGREPKSIIIGTIHDNPELLGGAE